MLFGNLAEDGWHRENGGRRREHSKVLGSGADFREPGRRRPRASCWTRSSRGDVVVIRYEGPKGGPGMQEMLYPTRYLKSKGLGKVCALITDGRFSGGDLGALDRARVARGRRKAERSRSSEEGDPIEIDIPARSVHLAIAEEELHERRCAHGGARRGLVYAA